MLWLTMGTSPSATHFNNFSTFFSVADRGISLLRRARVAAATQAKLGQEEADISFTEEGDLMVDTGGGCLLLLAADNSGMVGLGGIADWKNE